MVQTVCGETEGKNLKTTSAHEHIFIDMRKCVTLTGNEKEEFYGKITAKERWKVFCDPYAVLDNALLDEYGDAVNELRLFKAAGGCSIIDCTPDEIGRDPVALKKISKATGVNIVLGCGHYYDRAHFDYVKDATVSVLAQEIRKDLTVGIKDTSVKAGIIGELGTSAVITDSEKKVLRAGGIVSAELDKAIHVHTDLYTENGFEVIDILTAEGAKPERICIDHTDVLIRYDYMRKLLDKGVYLEFDNFGKEFYVDKSRRFAYDLERIETLSRLINDGYSERILISNDICLKTMWCKYGGNGYAHILLNVRKMAEDYGIDEKTYNKILTENVKKFID